MISCFSFYANKNITTGEGGMACTEDDALADRMRIMSLHGISRDAWKRFSSEGSWYFEIQAPGFKYNMTDIAASIGLHQLAKADRLHARRTQCAERYGQRLQGIDELILPQSRPDRIHSWHLYVIRLKTERLTLDRNEFMSALKDRGIGTAVHWMPLHMHPYYRDTFGYRPADLPVAASIYPQIVSLPFYPEITDKQIDAVCEAIRDVIAGHCR